MSMSLLRRTRTLLVKRAATISLVVLVVVVVLGSTFAGPGFIAKPLPVPNMVATTWLTFNGILCLVAGGFTLRNMYRLEAGLTSSQIASGRGIVWVCAGASLGYLAHLVTDTNHGYISLGTGGVTLGMLALIYGALDPDLKVFTLSSEAEVSDGRPGGPD